MSLRIRQTSSRKSQLIVTLFAAFALVAQPLYGLVQVRVAYADTNPITQISFESAPQTVATNTRSEKIQVRTKNYQGVNTVVGANTTFTVSSSSSTGRFARTVTSDFGSTNSQAITFTSGNSLQSFYYEDGVPGTPTITVSLSGDNVSGTVSATQIITITGPSPLATPERVSPGDEPVKGADLTSDWSDVADATSYIYQSFNLDGNGNCDLSSQRGSDQTFTESHSNATDETQSYCWRVMAKNIANSSSWSNAWKVTVDNDAPTVTLDPIGTVGGKDADGNDVNSVAFTGSISDANGVSGYSYQLLDANGNVLQGPFSSGAPASSTLGSLDISSYEGNYLIRVIATDEAGNSSNPMDMPFTVDRTAPSLTAQMINSPSFMASTEPIMLQGTVGVDFKTLSLVRDHNEKIIDLTGGVDADGNWTYSIPKAQVEQGNYVFSVVATDELGNSRTVSLPLITVSAFVPGMGSAIPTDLTKSLVDSFIVPRPLTSMTTPFTTPAQTAPDEAVLGAQTAKTSSDASNLPPVATTAEGWKFFGIAWYWWTMIAVGVGGMSWWTIATFRRKSELV